MVVDLAVVVAVVVACLWLLFFIGAATAFGVHVAVAAVPSKKRPISFSSGSTSFLPSSFLVSLLSSFLPSFLPAFRSLQEKEGNKGFLREI